MPPNIDGKANWIIKVLWYLNVHNLATFDIPGSIINNYFISGVLPHHQLLIINKHYLARDRSLHLLLLYYKWPTPINNTSIASHIKDHLLLLTPTSQYCNTQQSSGQIKHELFQCWWKSNEWYTRVEQSTSSGMTRQNKVCKN